MRLLSLKDVLTHFLSRCQDHHGASRAQSEIISRRVVEGPMQYGQMQAEMDKLNSYITNGEHEVAAWISHLATMRSIRQCLEEAMRLHRDKAVTRIQAKWHVISAHRCAEREHRSRATTRIQSAASRRMAEYCCQTSMWCIRAAA